MPKDKTNYIVGGVVLIIIILLGALFISRHVSKPAGDTMTGTGTGSTDGLPEVSVSAADQAAGEMVSVSSVSLIQNSWVVVKEANSVRILGAARVTSGATSASVPLLRATTEGEKYEVVVYSDDGDKAFDFRKDILIQGVGASFEAK